MRLRCKDEIFDGDFVDRKSDVLGEGDGEGVDSGGGGVGNR